MIFVMRVWFLVAIMFLASMVGISQEHSISGTITGLKNENLYLMQLMGEKRTIVDTATTDLTGAFTFEMPENSEPGMYVVINGPEKAVELIYNNEDIQFVTTGFNKTDGIQIVNSIENLIYYDYLNIKGIDTYKLDLLKKFINSYPPDDSFYTDALNRYKTVQYELNTRIDQLIDNNPETLAAQFLKADRPIFADPTITIDEQNIYLKKHYFDNVDFNDTMLIRSTFLTSKVVGYLSLYQNNANSQDELEDNMLIGVDSVLAYAQVNQRIYEFLTNFLIHGFESIGFDKGLEHIASVNTLDQFCENTERKLKLTNKLELIKKLAIGQIAPNFDTTDVEGNRIVLSEFKAKKTVLLFWASWCPHCDDIMPIINSYYDGGKNFKVIAISIDKSKEDLMSSIDDSGYSWTNIAELVGWNGKIVVEYGVVATPTIFVLDENKRIIGKPVGKKELEELLGNATGAK